MKILPRSMAGQLVTMLIVALLASHLLTVLALRTYSDVLNPMSRDHVLDRLLSAYQMAQIASDTELPALLEAISSPAASFQVQLNAPAPTPQEDRRPRLHKRLADMLPESTRARVRVDNSADASAAGSFPQFPAMRVSIAVELPDGRWLTADQYSHRDPPWWWLGLWLPVSVLPVLMLVILFIYRTLRPIKALANAAERVSHGERITPLPCVGPGEIREVSAAFNSMQSSITRFIDDRMRLLAAISHDVRTPIASLRLRVELVDDPSLREAMKRTLEDMSLMVEQTLHFSRDEASTEPVTDIDLQDLLKEVVQEARHANPDILVELQPGPVRLFRGRYTSLRRALVNLLDNAICHGDGQISVRLLDHPLRMEIANAGNPISPEQLEQVFNPFYQVDPARNHRQRGVGFGLGLSIARSCARAHGGDLVLENQEHGGVRAILSLP